MTTHDYCATSYCTVDNNNDAIQVLLVEQVTDGAWVRGRGATRSTRLGSATKEPSERVRTLRYQSEALCTRA